MFYATNMFYPESRYQILFFWYLKCLGASCLKYTKDNVKLSYIEFLEYNYRNNWRPPSLSKLTPIIFNMRLTHLGLDASNFIFHSNMKLYIYKGTNPAQLFIGNNRLFVYNNLSAEIAIF